MIKLHEVSKFYSANDNVTHALDNISINMELGEFIAIVGDSGSGKTTLINLIGGLDTFDEGEMFFCNEETSHYSISDWDHYRRKNIGFIFQDYSIIENYTVYQNIEISLILSGCKLSEIEVRIKKLLNRVGLFEYKDQKGSKLSGGQKQRCAIARALAKDCSVIICDELTSNLDNESAELIIELLYEISNEKLVIIVTHNFQEVKKYTTRNIKMFKGKIVEDVSNEKRQYLNSSTFEKFTDNGISYKQYIGIAIRNIFSMPKLSFFTFIITFLIVFILFFMLGNIKNLVNEDFEYEVGIWNNNYPSRIIVKKYDQSSFDSLEMDNIKSLSCNDLFDSTCVKSVVPVDYILDNIHYTSSNILVSESFNILPIELVEDSKLIEGEFPISYDQAIVSESLGYSLGDIVYLSDPYFGGINVSVVGIKRENNSRMYCYLNNQYFDEYQKLIIENTIDHSYDSNHEIDSSYIISKMDMKELKYGLDFEYSVKIYSNESIDNSTIIVSNVFYDNSIKKINGVYYNNDDYGTLQACILAGDCSNEDFIFSNNLTISKKIINNGTFLKTNNVHLSKIEYSEEISDYNSVYVSEFIFNQLSNTDTNQLSVFVKDLNSVDNVRNQLDTLGYDTVIPFEKTSAYIFIDESQENSVKFSVFILLGITTIIYFISFFLFKTIYFSKKKMYLVTRAIGASKNEILTICSIETTISLLFTYSLALIIYILNDYILPTNLINRNLKYFSLFDYIFYFVFIFIFLIYIVRIVVDKLFSKSVISNMNGN